MRPQAFKKRQLFYHLTVTLLFLLAASSSVLFPQTTVMRGDFVLRLVDSKGSPVASERVLLKGNGVKKENVSNTQGLCLFSDLPLGNYQVFLEKETSKDRALSNLKINLSRKTELTLTIDPAKQRWAADPEEIPLSYVRDQDANILKLEINIEGLYYTSEYFYDHKGQLIRFVDNFNELRQYEYDDKGRIARIRRSEGSDLIFRYDDSGNLKEVDLPAYSILYRISEQGVTKSIVRFGQTQVFELSYQLNKKGKKTSLIEKPGKVAHTFNYFYDSEGNLSGISDSMGKTSRVMSRNGRIYPYPARQINQKNGLYQDGLYNYGFDSRGNQVYLKHKSGVSEVYRYFNNRNLVSKETYYQDGQAVLDIRYRYDSRGQLILKNINEISIFYLRDKDGNIIHKIINDLNSGETFDWIVYNPSMLNFDTDGFELIRYTGKREGMKKETLLFKDFEGNIRLVIDMFDGPRIDESYIQRTVASDGDYLPEHEFILNYLVERAQNRKPDPHGLYNRLYDIYSQAQDISEEEDAISIKSAYAGEDDCCYYYGWCPPECSNCNDCGGGGGGGGEGGGGSGGGGGGGGSEVLPLFLDLCLFIQIQ